MEARYSRNIPALTQAQCAELRTKRIAVIGCGGLGGHIIELMARLGVGHIICVDGDVFEASNLNRQLLSEEAIMGKFKAEAAAKRIFQINSGVSSQVFTTYLDENNAQALIECCDLVFDALDNVDARKILEDACEKQNIPYIHGAVGGWVAQAAVCMPGQRLVQKLYPEGVVIKDKSVLGFAPALCASMQTALGVKMLLKLPVAAGTLYCFDLLNQEYEAIALV